MRRDPDTGKPGPFPEEVVDLSLSLASQAAVAMENAQLINDLKNLFDAFIKTIATAIDEKSPYTGGHISRVTDLTMMIAESVNQTDQSHFSAIEFNRDELEELRIAAWLHDIGKITTPEYVIDKAHKLETIFDRIELVRSRFNTIREQKRRQAAEEKLALYQENQFTAEKAAEIDQKLANELADMDSDEAFLVTCNTGRTILEPADITRLNDIAEKTYLLNSVKQPFITPDELENLSVRRGTLTKAERKIIENHALVSIKMLEQLPFPKKLSRVAKFAGGHHEKLDGSGYPYGLKADQLPIQARIMALADIFEALTARDRPYKKPMKLSRAIAILKSMSDDNHIDSDLLNLFLSEKIYLKYAEDRLDKDQIDVQ